MLKFKAYCQVCCEYVSVYDGFFQYKDGVYCQCPNHTVMTHTQLMQFTGLYEVGGFFSERPYEGSREVYSGDVYTDAGGKTYYIMMSPWNGVSLVSGSGYTFRLLDNNEELTFLRGKYESKV